MPLPSFALLSEWLQGWCPTPQLSQAAAGAVGTSWPLCLTGWIHGMNSLCAAAVLVLPVQSLLPPCMPPLKGGAPTPCALPWHSLLFLTNSAVL